eukprot:scaffold485644_cov52-Prasinocladus_malaysianus.AAC.1
MFCAQVIAILAFAPIPNAKPVTYWDMDGVLISIPVVLYAFTSHTVLFAVYSTMRTSSVSRMQNVVSKSLTGCAMVYIIVGIGGYMAFRQRTAGDVLRNLGGSSTTGLRSLYERALRLGYGLAVLGCIPMVMLPLQHTLLPIIFPVAARLPYASYLTRSSLPASTSPAGTKGNLSITYKIDESCCAGNIGNLSPYSPGQIAGDGMDVSSPLAFGLTAVLAVLAMLFAMWLPNVELILGLMGSTAAVGVGMVLPSAAFLRASYMHERLQVSTNANTTEFRLERARLKRKAAEVEHQSRGVASGASPADNASRALENVEETVGFIPE